MLNENIHRATTSARKPELSIAILGHPRSRQAGHFYVARPPPARMLLTRCSFAPRRRQARGVMRSPLTNSAAGPLYGDPAVSRGRRCSCLPRAGEQRRGRLPPAGSPRRAPGGSGRSLRATTPRAERLVGASPRGSRARRLAQPVDALRPSLSLPTAKPEPRATFPRGHQCFASCTSGEAGHGVE
jgi:hypothetical protein